jgi:cellulose synthase/poly-beta-1,6-N-acetylglucosamine synthase-like glycosyltransferase
MSKHKENVTIMPNERKLLFGMGEDQQLLLTVPIRVRVEKVFWAFPMDELMYSLFFRNFIQLSFMPWDDYAIQIGTYLPIARNTLHNAFLKRKDFKYMVMLDSDVLPPPDFLERLMKHDKPVVGGWYRKKGGKCEPVVYDYHSTDEKGIVYWDKRFEEGKGLEQVGAIGAGCVLMRRDAAEALGENPYDMNSGGEDMKLCLRLKELGIPIFVDWSIQCAHAGIGMT